MSLISQIRSALGITGPYRAPLPASTTLLQSYVIDEPPESRAEKAYLASTADDPKGETKDFDWQHYQTVSQGSTQGTFQNEYNITPTVATLEQLYATESVVNLGINAIVRQFMATKLYVGRVNPTTGEVTKNYNHALVRLLQNPGSESAASFIGNSAGGLLPLTGNAFWWIAPGNKRLKRLLPSRVQLTYGKDGALVGYKVRAGGYDESAASREVIDVPYDRMVHLKRPNLYTNRVGLSLLIASAQPVLADKYMYEYILGIYLRGGTLSGVIETKNQDVKQIARLIKSIQQIIGTRRNMHSDKILPEDASWKAAAKGPAEIQLLETMRLNARRIMGHMKIPPFEFGDTDSVNRANADAQMEQMWTGCVIPEQQNFCDSVKSSPLATLFGLADDEFLAFDNSHVPFLDPLLRMLETDGKLAGLLTVNERRTRLGWKPLGSEYDRLQAQIAPATMGNVTLALPTDAPGAIVDAPLALEGAKENPTEASLSETLVAFKAEAEKLNDEPSKLLKMMEEELQTCADIVANYPDSPKEARVAIDKRADAFAEKWALETTPSVMRAYDQQMRRVDPKKRLTGGKEKGAPLFVSKETEQDRQAKLDALRNRAENFLRGKIRADQKKSFLGYTRTLTDFAYSAIDEALKDGASLDEAAARLRLEFGEAYEHQATTIVRTEYLSGVSLAVDRFGRDLAKVAKRTKKTWIHSGSAGQPRAEHLELDGVEIEGPADDVPDARFLRNLRYPRDPQGDAGDVISCRCVMVNEVSDWGDEDE